MAKDQENRSEGAPLVVSFGEMLIDFVPDVAGVSLAESGGFVKAPGGAPANVAVAITKLGGRSAFVGKVNVAHPNPPTLKDLIWLHSTNLRTHARFSLLLSLYVVIVGGDTRSATGARDSLVGPSRWVPGRRAEIKFGGVPDRPI